MAERVNVSLGDDLYDKLRKRAEFTGASMSSIMSLAYANYENQQMMADELPMMVKLMSSSEFQEALKNENASKA